MNEKKLYIDDGELVYYINENEFFTCDEIPMPMLEGIKHLQQKVEQLEQEIDRLNKEYERIYNENCKLRENHNINDITLLDENERLNRIIDNIFKFMQNKYDNSDFTGFLINVYEKSILDAKHIIENSYKEIDRLNNIINELEEYCWELKAMGCREGALDMLDKLKELKKNK